MIELKILIKKGSELIFGAWIETQRFRDDDCAGFLSRCGVCRGGGWPTPEGSGKGWQRVRSFHVINTSVGWPRSSPFSLAAHAKSCRHRLPRHEFFFLSSPRAAAAPSYRLLSSRRCRDGVCPPFSPLLAK